MHGFLQKVRQQIQSQQLLEAGGRVVAAVSGGADSVSLALALHGLRYELELAHVDHGTRPETGEDAAFVGQLAQALGVPFHALTCAPGSGSEDDLRQGRYAAFEALGAPAIATGHTADDQAETVLLRVLRGTGLSGLSAIPPRRGVYIRPLLAVTRAEVLDYLSAREQPFRTDPSNASTDPLRNRVRHVLLPLLSSDFQPNIRRALTRLADSARSDRAFIEAAAAAHLEEYGLAVTPLRQTHAGLVPHILRAAAKVPITAERMAAITRLIHGRGGAVQLEGGKTVVIGKLRAKGLPNQDGCLVFIDSGRDPA